VKRQAVSARFLLSLVAALIASYVLYSSYGWPLRTALFPRLIGIPLLFLAVLEMGLSLFGTEKQGEGPAVDFQLTTEVEPRVAHRRTFAILAWTLGFFGLILLVGFPVGVPVFVFFYLKVAGKEGWLLTILFAALSWLFVEGLFIRILHVPFPEGWIFSLGP
jgi:hypothetical protein